MAPRTKKIGFHEYRYQILPTSQTIQLDIEGSIKDLADLKRQKNELFRRAVSTVKTFSYSRGDIRHKVWHDDDIFVLQIGVERDLKRITREFEIEDVENWPTVYVVFNNDPAIQKCLVQQGGGFQRTITVLKIIEQSLNAVLARYQLSVAFEPIYSESYFWDLVEQYRERITQIEFELISPNMSNISESLTFDLAQLNRSTNTQRTNLQLNSDVNTALTPTADDPLIGGLVKYSSEGGGDITMRARGVRKKIHTAKGVKEITIEEIEVEGATQEQILRMFKEICR